MNFSHHALSLVVSHPACHSVMQAINFVARLCARHHRTQQEGGEKNSPVGNKMFSLVFRKNVGNMEVACVVCGPGAPSDMIYFFERNLFSNIGFWGVFFMGDTLATPLLEVYDINTDIFKRIMKFCLFSLPGKVRKPFHADTNGREAYWATWFHS